LAESVGVEVGEEVEFEVGFGVAVEFEVGAGVAVGLGVAVAAWTVIVPVTLG
jgi:hypothetical protein